ALSAFGNMLASALSLKITPGQENYWGHYSGWQVLAFLSILPAVMVVPMVLVLREPQAWRKAKADAASGGSTRSVASLGDLFKEARWRKNLLVGVCLGVAGMVGLWGIAFFSPELITAALKNRPLTPQDILKPEEVCVALQNPLTPQVREIKRHLSPGLLVELERPGSFEPMKNSLLQALVRDLNAVIPGPSLYTSASFPTANLKKSTQTLIQLVQRTGRPENINFLNRQLIEQAFAGMIREKQQTIDTMRSRGTLLQDVGALLGMFAFTFAAARF